MLGLEAQQNLRRKAGSTSAAAREPGDSAGAREPMPCLWVLRGAGPVSPVRAPGSSGLEGKHSIWEI